MAASQNSLQHRVPYYHAFPVCQFSKFPPHGLREYVRIRPAVRINLASKNRTVIPAKRRLHKIPKHHTTETRRPVRETFRQRIDLAGLLTDPCPEAFPPAGQWLRYSERHGASQQRDCPGFAPDSLFTPSRDGERRTKSEANIADYSEKLSGNPDYFHKPAPRHGKTAIFTTWIFRFHIRPGIFRQNFPLPITSPVSAMPNGSGTTAAPAPITGAAGDAPLSDSASGGTFPATPRHCSPLRKSFRKSRGSPRRKPDG